MRLLLVALVLLVALPAVALDLRRLEHVELREDDSGTWLSLSTDRPANFTSFKLDEPTRIVVDFPEMTTAPQDAEGEGPVQRWSCRTLGDVQSPVVRLIVELSEDADYTLVADGTQIALRLQPATGRPLVALDGERIPPTSKALGSAGVIEPQADREPVLAPEVTSAVAVARPAPVLIAQLRPQPSPAVSEAPRQVQRATERKARASLDQVSFRRTPGGARIVLRTSQPVTWALVEDVSDVIYLELEDTLISATRNRLPLDTRYFGTPVARVVPREQRREGSTRVAVELGAPARWSAFADGSDIVLEVRSDATRAALAGGEPW